MTASNFDSAFARVLKYEGGFVNDPADPGGATNLGVTIGTLSDHLGRRATVAEVRALTPSTVKPIYRARYWQAIHADDLPDGVDLAAFDFAVNSGVSRAAHAVQRACGVADDGQIGPITLAAAGRYDPAVLVERICDDRLAFLRRLSTWPRFGKGWTSRIGAVRTAALDMAHARPKPLPAEPIALAPRPNLPSSGSGVKPAPASPPTVAVVVPASATPPGFMARVLARLRTTYPPASQP